MSGRAQRKIAEEQSARRKRLMLLGGAIAGALVIALVVFLVTRPRDVGPPVLAADALPASVPVAGKSMGPEDAPVTVVEWGDFT
jgi:hypothetical protein